MAKPTIKPTKPTTKRKQSKPTKSVNKQAKNWVCRYLWIVILAGNNSKLNEIGLSEILNLKFSIPSIALANKQRKIDCSLFQIDSGDFFCQILYF